MPPEFSPDDLQSLRACLEACGLVSPATPLTLSVAGEGNMNCVRRVETPAGSFIVKHARPWVEKYPSIAAPVERAAFEARFYALTADDPVLGKFHPVLRYSDPAAAVLVLEDLAPATSGGEVYAGDLRFSPDDLMALLGYLRALHRLPVPAAARPGLRNAAMRRLNHAHIFDLPFQPDAGFGEFLEARTPGLDAVADPLRHDEALRVTVSDLGARYLNSDGPALLHGDFFPGSLLRQTGGSWRVIDPEFGFCGDPEFDTGVFLAHLHLSGHPEDLCHFWQDRAQGDPALVRRYAGVEILRRLIGVAQLPLPWTLAEKTTLIARAREMVLSAHRFGETDSISGNP
jgi:5-methylthioribose kinase